MAKEPIKDSPIFFENGAVEVKIVRNAGHPWNGEGNFDHAYIDAITGNEDAMKRVVKEFEKKFWKYWIFGVDRLSGNPGGVMWKPSGIQADWDPSPGKQ